MDDQSAPEGDACQHSELDCLNQHEIIRKYRCGACGAVMMCRCDEAFARRFLAHQINVACELETQDRIPVTHGFQQRTCNECRGLPATCAPAGEIHGRGSKIKRYYWREIYFGTTVRLAAWAELNGVEWKSAQWDAEHAAVRKRLEKEAIAEWSQRHDASPKYKWEEASDAEILKNYNVEVLEIYVKFSDRQAGRRAQVLDGTEWVGVEPYVQRYYERQGYEVLTLESRPIHVLFGAFMWQLIQDAADDATRLVGFGVGTPGQISGKDMNYMLMPHDFGSPGYARRRKQTIDEHLASIPTDTGGLERRFDEWLQPSLQLRQYLGANVDEDIRSARRLLGVFSPEVVVRVLRYLVTDYWRRYLGWPDLLVFRAGQYALVEVKARNDDLTDDQKTWIQGNVQELSMPFRIAKLRKQTGKERN